MQPYVALIGGEEFSDGFTAVHSELYASLGSGRHRVVYLPTCAADDGVEVVSYWCEQARTRLSKLGASVETPLIVDRESANELRYSHLIENADWVYFGGGFPEVAMKILPDTRAIEAMRRAIERGALISGASGGAMLMGALSWETTPEIKEALATYWDNGIPKDWEAPPSAIIDCLGLVPEAIFWPHYERTFSATWLKQLGIPAGFKLVGINEMTALVNVDGRWIVKGHGDVTLIDEDFTYRAFTPGSQIMF